MVNVYIKQQIKTYNKYYLLKETMYEYNVIVKVDTLVCIGNNKLLTLSNWNA